ncbi:MAG: hypothetical protein JRI96_08510 [Deltaproteobacteria bacterium]|nr:hypothetical protein [Deltaproteobacteria bacterium]
MRYVSRDNLNITIADAFSAAHNTTSKLRDVTRFCFEWFLIQAGALPCHNGLIKCYRIINCLKILANWRDNNRDNNPVVNMKQA